MRTAQDVARFISDEPAMMRTLTLAAALDLPDAWIGTGFLRNALWDALHDRPTPAGLRKPQAFKARVREKNWLRRWPRLHLG